MKPLRSPLFASILFLGLLPIQNAHACEPVGKGITIKNITYYSPWSDHEMNGTHSTSASGIPAGNHSFEDFIEGKTDFIMGAVPQKRGTSFLWGGYYRAVAVEKSTGKKTCIVVRTRDRFAKKYDGFNKLDLVTKENCVRQAFAGIPWLKIGKKTCTWAGKIDLAEKYGSPSLLPLGRDKKLPPPARKIERNPAATTPVAPNQERCRTVKRCKINSQVLSGSACNRLGSISRYICFEKEQSCNPNPGSCTDAL
jgi:hypothetical protein